MKRFIKWLRGIFSPQKTSRGPELTQTGSHLRQTGSQLKRKGPGVRQTVPRRQPDFVDLNPKLAGRMEDSGPGKSVLIRNKYVREDSGTHETLTILDDSLIDNDDEAGIDPYNTGDFDRSKNWDKRTRKN